MNHMTYDNWLQYVNDELDEETRNHYENHLYSCDDCLELYLQAVEANEFQLPELTTTFTDSIMQQVQGMRKDEGAASKAVKQNKFRKQTITHYILAAAMTMILMSTGVFSQLMNVAGTIENNETKQPESFVHSFLNKQDSIFNKLENNFKEGNQ